jgi:hypothetical protein
MPATLALILAKAPKDNDVDKEDDEIPEIIAIRVKQAQLQDNTCLRVIKKLTNGERKDYKVTLAYASVEERALFIDGKL